MSEDTNDETAGRAGAWESATGHDAAVPEDPAQAIALPSVTPPAPAADAAPTAPAPPVAAAAPQRPQRPRRHHRGCP